MYVNICIIHNKYHHIMTYSLAGIVKRSPSDIVIDIGITVSISHQISHYIEVPITGGSVVRTKPHVMDNTIQIYLYIKEVYTF